ncbi:pilus assembly protein PilM [Patescibacteria group bacterium AH-259-L07]|nr:pilus assembly protein PilM [Patescibacteria group bacterium AH-259-L07]
MFTLFQKKSVGLDIADHTIEAVELVKTERGIKVVSVSRSTLEPGIVEQGRIKNKEKLIRAVKDTLSAAQPHKIVAKKVTFALPASQVYIHMFDIVLKGKGATARLAAGERKKLVLEKAEESIPIDKKNLVLGYKIQGVTVLDQYSIGIENLVVATSRDVVLEWQQFFKKVNIEIEFFDIESLATFRGLFIKPPKKPIGILDIGAGTTNVAIFDKGDLRFSYTTRIAGDRVTANIAQRLHITREQAEELKIKNGFSGRNENVVSSIEQTLHPAVVEIRESLTYFRNKTQKEVSKILIVGGSSRLKGLESYISKELGLPASLGEPALAFNKEESLQPRFYIGALGMALRSFNKKWEQQHPVIQKVKEVKSSEVEKEKQEKEEPLPAEAMESKEERYVIKTEEETKKLRARKIILIGIVVVGATAFGLVSLYRKHEKEQQRAAVESVIVQYSRTQSFDIRIPAAVDPREYTSDRVPGRIIENEIIAAGDYTEAVAHARIQAEKELQQGEVLWQKPISQEPEALDFPLIIQWVAYASDESNNLLIKEVDKLNTKNIDYALNNIVKLKLEPSDNENIHILTGRVTISVNQLIDVEEEQLTP